SHRGVHAHGGGRAPRLPRGLVLAAPPYAVNRSNRSLLASACSALACCVFASGCGPATEGTAVARASPWLTPGTGQQNAISGSVAERFFPLVDGMVYTY